jgi:sRNA-binding carbon storage regulator CsrA
MLTRRDGQRVVITTPEGRRITVEVNLNRHLGQVRMRIEADREVQILREELTPPGGPAASNRRFWQSLIAGPGLWSE